MSGFDRDPTRPPAPPPPFPWGLVALALASVGAGLVFAAWLARWTDRLINGGSQ